ncbi:hypothetical protein O9K51_05171 [Purpureocillium lavendulum]|uniref:Hemerythrin-like domain-containing protein n=1 Tax=Purpureocillium lavendulum TaxID=1247861 RepID=A0AB34FRV9_9HYPO|nr:hypothetical protein O9K51_05171 [Purpureocillium lavendulum]
MSTISDVITKDHRELEQYHNEVVNNAGNCDHQQRYGNQFTWELARHSVGEELVVYPAFEKHLGTKGKEMAEHDRKEHHQVRPTISRRLESGGALFLPYRAQVKELLKDFQGMKSSDDGYVAKLEEIWALLSKHMKEEEEQDMPELESKLIASQGESESMATTFGRTKAFVPSRSHPSAGEHPPFETAMGLLTAPYDHVADVFRKFPDETLSPNPSTK